MAPILRNTKYELKREDYSKRELKFNQEIKKEQIIATVLYTFR